MKAIVIREPGGPEVLKIEEIPEPAVGPDDLLVRVHAAGVNRADLLQRQGHYPQPGKPPAFEVPGLEYAGEVVAIGERVLGFAEGDRVMGLMPGGGYAEYVSTPSRLAVRVPDVLSWDEAGGTPEVYITAHDALLQCDLVAGETVLIHAAGSGVGVAAAQIAKAMGASLTIGTAGSAAKLEAAAKLGLDVGVNYHTQDFAAEVMTATSGRGVDVLLDVIGAAYWAQNMQSLAMLGRMVIVGMMGGTKIEVDLSVFSRKRLQLRGTALRARTLEYKALATREFEKSVVPHLASGRIKVPVDRVFQLAAAGAAHEYLASNANFGKVVLQVA